MKTLMLVLLIPTAMLLPSCATGLSQIRDDIATVAAKTKAGFEKGEAAVEKLKADFEARQKAAQDEFRAKGAPVDGTPADLVAWAKQNPFAAAGSPMAFLLVLFAAYRKARTATRALTASVDAVESLPPDAAAAFKAGASASTHMGTAEAALIAALKAR